MQKLDGKLVSQTLRSTMALETEELKKQGVVPGLAVILVGEDPASQVYVRNKARACEEVGFNSWVHRVPGDAGFDQVGDLISRLNGDPAVHGILLQLPVPKHLNGEKLIQHIDPRKDPDGLTLENIGLLFSGRPRVISCTPFGVMKIFEYYKVAVEGRSAVVVGRSQIVGLPMFQLLQRAGATVTLCHSKTKNLRDFTLNADLVVVAAGRPHFLGRGDFKRGAVVVDVGIHRQGDGGLCGDVDPKGLEDWVSGLTPVPGGVGPMTITMLLQNTLTLARAQVKA